MLTPQLGDQQLQMRTIASAPEARASASLARRALGGQRRLQRLDVVGQVSDASSRHRLSNHQCRTADSPRGIVQA